MSASTTALRPFWVMTLLRTLLSSALIGLRPRRAGTTASTQAPLPASLEV
ncbi:MAG: hypothetical protein QM820_57075 [Minicystis sp.]